MRPFVSAAEREPRACTCRDPGACTAACRGSRAEPAIGASKVREAVDEAKGELRTRTPRFARVAPAGNLAVSVGTIGPDPTTYAYLALWQHGTDEQWRLLFFTPVLPQ